MSDWERWLEFCARIDGFPRHLSIHSGGMLVTAAPLIDIAPIERATMQDRVVVQFDKRDVEELKLIKLDLLGLGMLAAIDETLQLIEHDCGTCVVLDAIPEEVPEVFEMIQAADTVGVFQIESRAQMQTLPKSRPSTPRRSRRRGRDHPARPDPGQRRAPVPAAEAGPRAGDVPPPEPRAGPAGLDGRDPVPGAGHADRDRGRGLLAGGERRVPAGDGHVALEPRDGEAPPAVPRRLHAPAGHDRGDRRGAVPAGLGVRAASGSRRATPPRSRGPPTSPSFLKLFYPAQFLVGLINAQPMGFYPVEVLVNDAKRHGVAVLPVDLNASTYKTTTEWVGRPGWALAGAAGDDGSHDDEAIDPGERAARGLRHRGAAAAGPLGVVRDARARPRGSSGRPRARPAGASGSGCTS